MARPLEVKLSKRLVGAFFLLTFVSVGLAAATGYQNARHFRRAAWTAKANQLAGLAVEANVIQARERGFTATALARPSSGTQETLAEIATLRREGDLAFDRARLLAEAVAREAGGHGLAAHLRDLSAKRARLLQARLEADAALAGRSALAPEVWITTATAAIEALADVRRAAYASPEPMERFYHDSLMVAEYTFQATEHAGLERAMLGVAINGRSPLEGQRLSELEHHRKIVDENLGRLVELGNGRPAPAPELEQAVSRMNDEFFGRFELLRRQVYEAGKRGLPYPVGAREWWEKATSGIGSVLEVAEVMNRESARKVAQVERRLRWSFAGLAGLTAASVAGAVLVALQIRRRILLPLHELLLAARAIQQGDLGRPVDAQGRDEFGELSRAFEAMRRSLNERSAEQRELVEKLEEAALQRQELLQLVSHDLRGPLSVVLAQVQSILRRLGDGGDAQLLRSLSSIERGGRRLAAMVGDLLDTTSLESGQLELRRVPTSLPALASELAEALVPGERERIRLEVSGELPEVQVDQARVERALLNLLTNALKYSPAHAQVTVRIERMDNELVTSVADQGRGIAPEAVPRLFERFYRVSGGENVEGLGLGLYITRLLIEAHGGRVWVESEPGEGSTFFFALPITNGRPTALDSRS